VKWQGDISTHVATYMQSFEKFRERICVPKAQSLFDEYLKAYRGQGYWIPELNDDVDVESISVLLPEFEKKLAWIKKQKEKVKKHGLPAKKVTLDVRYLLARLLELKITLKEELQKIY
jgi:hypothetical protein